MGLELSIAAVLWAAAVFLVAGYARGFSGFGFSAVTVAGLAFVVSPTVAVSTAILLEVFASLVQARSIWTQVDWRRLAILLVGGLLGTPLGVVVLETAPQDVLKAAIYCFLLTVAAILTFARPMPIRLPVAGWFVVALIAGAVNGATAMSGLFIVAVMTLVSVPAAQMRATLVAYFFFADLYATGLFWARGMIGAETLWLCLFAVPLVVLGIIFGSRKFLETSEARFRQATLALLSLLSVVGLVDLLFVS